MKYLTSRDGQQEWTDLIGARSISPVKAVAQSDKWLHYGGSRARSSWIRCPSPRCPRSTSATGMRRRRSGTRSSVPWIPGQQTVEQAVKNILDQLPPVLNESK